MELKTGENATWKKKEFSETLDSFVSKMNESYKNQAKKKNATYGKKK